MREAGALREFFASAAGRPPDREHRLPGAGLLSQAATEVYEKFLHLNDITGKSLYQPAGEKLFSANWYLMLTIIPTMA